MRKLCMVPYLPPTNSPMSHRTSSSCSNVMVLLTRVSKILALPKKDFGVVSSCANAVPAVAMIRAANKTCAKSVNEKKDGGE